MDADRALLVSLQKRNNFRYLAVLFATDHHARPANFRRFETPKRAVEKIEKTFYKGLRILGKNIFVKVHLPDKPIAYCTLVMVCKYKVWIDGEHFVIIAVRSSREEDSGSAQRSDGCGPGWSRRPVPLVKDHQFDKPP